MQSSRIYKAVSRPFRNLSALDSLVLWIRLTSTILIISLGMTVVLGPITLPGRLYMGQFNTRAPDITEGLFKELETAVEVFGSTDVNSGVGLTTSEILILTEYTAKKTEGLPQFLTFSLYGQCSVKFTTIEELNFVNGKQKISLVKNSTEQENCEQLGFDYIFDYREVLAQLSLDIVLDYAYDRDLSSSLGVSSEYTSYMEGLRNRKVTSLDLFCVVIALQVIMFGITLWYYNIKGRSINPLKERILSHVLSFVSIVVFFCGLVAIINLAWITYSLQDRIEHELALFGFSLIIGKPWFICLLVFSFFIIISTVFWSGLEWCITNVSKPFNDETRNNILGYEAGVLTSWDDRISNITSRHSFDETTISRVPSPSVDRIEVHEMEELSRYSTGGSDLFHQKSVKPSSTMYF